MKASRTILALSPLLTFALFGCGGNSSSSTPVQTSGQTPSVSSSSASFVPALSTERSEQQHFDDLNAARKRTSEADKLRVYTPHANTILQVPENGYLNFSGGLTVEVKEDASETSSEGGNDFLGAGTHSFSFTVKEMPFDIRLKNIQQGNSKLLGSFANYIDERMANCAIKFDTISRDKLDMAIDFYIDDGAFYFDLSSLNSLMSIFGIGSLPGRGKFTLDIPEDFSVSDIIYPEGASSEKKDTFSEKVSELLDRMGYGNIDPLSIIDSMKSIDIDLFHSTAAKMWTFTDSSIEFKVNGENEFVDFLMGVYDKNHKEEATSADRETFLADLEEALTYLEFDHFSYFIRFDENGLNYNSVSFLIKSFDKDKYAEAQKEESTLVYPSGELSLNYGLYYDYSDVEPATLTLAKKNKYTKTTIDELLDSIREAIESFLPEQTQVIESSEEN